MGNKVDITSAGVTGGAQVLAALDPCSQIVAVSLIATLGFSFSVLSYFSDKRNKELFSRKKLVDQVAKKVKASDDFASFVFDIWQKHNLESCEKRRKLLKELLEQESFNQKNDYDNFSRILFIMQNANLDALRLLSIIHSDVVQKRKTNLNDASDRHLNLTKLIPLVQSVESIHEQDIEYYLNELGNFGLVSLLHGRMAGPYFLETKLGYSFIKYLKT